MKLHIKIIISLILILSVNLMAENVYKIEDIELKKHIIYVKNTNEKVNGILKRYYDSGALQIE